MTKPKKLAAQKDAVTFGVDDHLEVDAKTGTLKVKDELYEKSLEIGEIGVTLDQVQKLRAHDARVIAATTYAGGEKARDYFADNEGVNEMTMSQDLGGIKHDAHFQRTSEEVKDPVWHAFEVPGTDDKGSMHDVHKALTKMFDDL